MPTELESLVYERLMRDALLQRGHDDIDVAPGRPLDPEAREMRSLGPALSFSATISTTGEDATTIGEVLEDADDLVAKTAAQILDDAINEEPLFMPEWQLGEVGSNLLSCAGVVLSWNAWRAESFPAGLPRELIRGGSLAVPYGQLVLLLGGRGQYHVEARVSDTQQGSRHKIDISVSAWRFEERRRGQVVRPRVLRIQVKDPASFLLPQKPTPLQQMLESKHLEGGGA